MRDGNSNHRTFHSDLCRHIDLRLKQKTRDSRECLMVRAFPKKSETIAQEGWEEESQILLVARLRN